MNENRRAILFPEIRPLPVHLRGIMRLPENVQQLFVAYLGRIKRHLHHFRVSRFIRAHILVSGVFRVATAIAHGRLHHSRHALKCCLHSPEAPCSKCCNLCHRNSPSASFSSHTLNAIVGCATDSLRFFKESTTVSALLARQGLSTYPAPSLCKGYLRKLLA